MISDFMETYVQALKTLLSKINNMNFLKFLASGLFFLFLINLVSAAAPTASSCGGDVLTPGNYVTSGAYKVRVNGVSAYGTFVNVEILKNDGTRDRHVTTLEGTYVGRTVSYTDGENTLSVEICDAGPDRTDKWADVKVTENGATPSSETTEEPEPVEDEAPTDATCGGKKIKKKQKKKKKTL